MRSTIVKLMISEKEYNPSNCRINNGLTLMFLAHARHFVKILDSAFDMLGPDLKINADRNIARLGRSPPDHVRRQTRILPVYGTSYTGVAGRYTGIRRIQRACRRLLATGLLGTHEGYERGHGTSPKERSDNLVITRCDSRTRLGQKKRWKAVLKKQEQKLYINSLIVSCINKHPSLFQKMN